jgi:hypothetical protein
MRTSKLDRATPAAAGALLLAIVLAGCDRPAPQATPSESSPPAATPPAETLPPPEATPAEPAQPAPDAPPPAEPSAVPKPAAREPELESMLVAKASSKLSVAVSLRYSFDGAVSANQPVTLHLAALPRVEGTNLKVAVKEVNGIRLAEGPLSLQKAGSSTVYRKQVSVTPLAGSPTELRVLVTMNVGPDLGFGYFTIPLSGTPSAGTNAQKQESVKLP